MNLNLTLLQHQYLTNSVSISGPCTLAISRSGYRCFAWMERFCDEYSGGIWSFYTLSNGGAFMAPDADSDDKWHLLNSMNGNDAEMSAEAAGIAACLIEYSHHACRTECDAMTEHYYRLRDYALQHPESSTILRIID